MYRVVLLLLPVMISSDHLCDRLAHEDVKLQSVSNTKNGLYVVESDHLYTIPHSSIGEESIALYGKSNGKRVVGVPWNQVDWLKLESSKQLLKLVMIPANTTVNLHYIFGPDDSIIVNNRTREVATINETVPDYTLVVDSKSPRSSVIFFSRSSNFSRKLVAMRKLGATSVLGYPDFDEPARDEFLTTNMQRDMVEFHTTPHRSLRLDLFLQPAFGFGHNGRMYLFSIPLKVVYIFKHRNHGHMIRHHWATFFHCNNQSSNQLEVKYLNQLEYTYLFASNEAQSRLSKDQVKKLIHSLMAAVCAVFLVITSIMTCWHFTGSSKQSRKGKKPAQQEASNNNKLNRNSSQFANFPIELIHLVFQAIITRRHNHIPKLKIRLKHSKHWPSLFWFRNKNSLHSFFSQKA